MISACWLANKKAPYCRGAFYLNSDESVYIMHYTLTGQIPALIAPIHSIPRFAILISVQNLPLPCRAVNVLGNSATVTGT